MYNIGPSRVSSLQKYFFEISEIEIVIEAELVNKFVVRILDASRIDNPSVTT
jgi:hypothetical protein